jgi:hypothetical protein
MSAQANIMTFGLSPRVQPILDSLAGETPDQKIAQLLSGAIQRNLETCERERLELEFKYGLEYQDFRQELEAGELGDAFSYELEMDAMRWDDLIVEKRHWLRQLNQLKASLR